MITYIDTHAHLYLSEFDADRETVVLNAVQRGVKKILVPNIDSSSIGPMNDLAARFPGTCFPMMGLHPTSVKEDYQDELDRVKQELKTGSYCAIGESGIDLYWDKSHLKEQCLAFATQLDLALEYRLPIVVHARESFQEILEILESYKDRGLSGVFHAFTATAEIARQVISMGFKLGIGGILTYKKSTLHEVVRETGLEHLVLETDSPYLTPVPFRGKRNESSYIIHIAEVLAAILEATPEEVGRVTTQNANHVFQTGPYA